MIGRTVINVPELGSVTIPGGGIAMAMALDGYSFGADVGAYQIRSMAPYRSAVKKYGQLVWFK